MYTFAKEYDNLPITDLLADHNKNFEYGHWDENNLDDEDDNAEYFIGYYYYIWSRLTNWLLKHKTKEELLSFFANTNNSQLVEPSTTIRKIKEAKSLGKILGLSKSNLALYILNSLQKEGIDVNADGVEITDDSPSILTIKQIGLHFNMSEDEINQTLADMGFQVLLVDENNKKQWFPKEKAKNFFVGKSHLKKKDGKVIIETTLQWTVEVINPIREYLLQKSKNI